MVERLPWLAVVRLDAIWEPSLRLSYGGGANRSWWCGSGSIGTDAARPKFVEVARSGWEEGACGWEEGGDGKLCGVWPVGGDLTGSLAESSPS